MWNSAFHHKGPGLLLRDILSGQDPAIELGAAMIAQVRPDILLITNFDYDAQQIASRAFADRIGALGWQMPHPFAFQPNTGLRTGFDIDGNGFTSGASDAQGYGVFPGQGGMVLLSRWPLAGDAQDFSQFLWRDLPGNQQRDPPELAAVQRLSSVGHWRVTYDIGGARLDILAWHAGTPAFDDETQRNARRNADENRFWLAYLDGALDFSHPSDAFVLLGTSNLDPADGEGEREVMQTLLSDPALTDPVPVSAGAVHAALADGAANQTHLGNPALDTANFRDEPGPGNLRVDYVLPSADLRVADAGVFWPAPDEVLGPKVSARDRGRSWHGIVWADIVLNQ